MPLQFPEVAGRTVAMVELAAEGDPPGTPWLRIAFEDGGDLTLGSPEIRIGDHVLEPVAFRRTESS